MKNLGATLVEEEQKTIAKYYFLKTKELELLARIFPHIPEVDLEAKGYTTLCNDAFSIESRRHWEASKKLLDYLAGPSHDIPLLLTYITKVGTKYYFNPEALKILGIIKPQKAPYPKSNQHQKKETSETTLEAFNKDLLTVAQVWDGKLPRVQIGEFTKEDRLTLERERFGTVKAICQRLAGTFYQDNLSPTIRTLWSSDGKIKGVVISAEGLDLFLWVIHDRRAKNHDKDRIVLRLRSTKVRPLLQYSNFWVLLIREPYWDDLGSADRENLERKYTKQGRIKKFNEIIHRNKLSFTAMIPLNSHKFINFLGWNPRSDFVQFKLRDVELFGQKNGLWTKKFTFDKFGDVLPQMIPNLQQCVNYQKTQKFKQLSPMSPIKITEPKENQKPNSRLFRTLLKNTVETAFRKVPTNRPITTQEFVQAIGYSEDEAKAVMEYALENGIIRLNMNQTPEKSIRVKEKMNRG